MSAGIATLEILQEKGFYQRLEEKSAMVADAISRAAADAGYPIYSTRVGSMLCVFFSRHEVHDWTTAAHCDTAAYGTYFRAMLEQGIYLAPSQFETAFVSIAHSAEDIERTAAAARNAFKILAAGDGRKIITGTESITSDLSEFSEFFQLFSTSRHRATRDFVSLIR